MNVAIVPHNDDEALFLSWTILRHRPLVVIVTDSARQWKRGTGITARQRRAESLAAMDILGAEVRFLGIPDDELTIPTVRRALEHLGDPEMVFAPAHEGPEGNADHNLVATACSVLANVTRYMTYTRAGKSTGVEVPYEPDWPRLKLQALACYESQIRLPSTAPHFLRGLHEYYLPKQ